MFDVAWSRQGPRTSPVLRSATDSSVQKARCYGEDLRPEFENLGSTWDPRRKRAAQLKPSQEPMFQMGAQDAPGTWPW